MEYPWNLKQKKKKIKGEGMTGGTWSPKRLTGVSCRVHMVEAHGGLEQGK